MVGPLVGPSSKSARLLSTLNFVRNKEQFCTFTMKKNPCNASMSLCTNCIQHSVIVYMAQESTVKPPINSTLSLLISTQVNKLHTKIQGETNCTLEKKTQLAYSLMTLRRLAGSFFSEWAYQFYSGGIQRKCLPWWFSVMFREKVAQISTFSLKNNHSKSTYLFPESTR